MLNGISSAVSTVIKDPRTGLPSPGNIIPASRVTPDGRAISGIYNRMIGAAQSFSDLPIANNSIFQADNPFDWRQDVLRLDYQPSGSHRITLRMINDNYDLIDPFGTFISNSSSLPTVPTHRRLPSRNYHVSHNWTIHSNLINELKVNTS